MRAGLLDAGLQEIDGLEKDGGEHARAEARGEVEGWNREALAGLVESLNRGFKNALDFVSAVREPSDIAALGDPLGGCRRCGLGVLKRARGRVLV
jgi:hypothetical protein